jgi:DNA-binding SARP family transcriptional activator
MSLPTAEGLTVGLLGPVEARRDGRLLNVGGRKQRIVLAVLSLDPGRMVPAERLLSALWGDEVPDKGTNTLQVYASNLRRALGGDQDGAHVLRWERPGYVLDIGPGAVDAGRFAASVVEGKALRRSGRLAEASQVLGTGLAQWRGPALADLADEWFAAGAIARLESERLSALEEQLDLDLQLGRHADLVERLQQLAQDNPLRERSHALLMLALYRCGRQAEALEVFRDVRDQLADQLGLDPGPELRELERAILAQSPTLLVPAAPAPPSWEPTVNVNAEDGVAARLVSAVATWQLSTSRALLGRATDCDIVIGDVRSSRRHAMIRTAAGRHEVVDLDSTNGTWVNGDPLVPGRARELSDGDELRVGETVLRYELGPGTADQPAG